MEAVRRAASSAFALLLARAEFAGIELSIAGAGVLRWLLGALLASVLVAAALIAVGAALVLALWDQFGWHTAALLSVVFCMAAAAAVYRLLTALANRPPLLAATLAEIAKDRDAFLGDAYSGREGDRAP